jgi:hypothetical protein
MELSGPLTTQDLVELFASKVFPRIEDTRISLFTYTIRKGEKFVANPCFGRKRVARQHWAMLEYAGIGEVPAHLLVFFHLPTDPSRPIRLNGSLINKAGYYVCCHVLPARLDADSVRQTEKDNQYTELAHPDQRLIFRCQKWDQQKHGEDCEYNKIYDDPVNPSLRFESCDSIARPCIAIPDFYGGEAPNHVYYILLPHSLWCEDFIDQARKHLQATEDSDSEESSTSSNDTARQKRRRI